jgi:hypothetical protein
MWWAKNKKVKGHISTHELTDGGGRGVNQNNTYAMPAACNIEMKPDIALGPIRVMRRAREGASADNTPLEVKRAEVRIASQRIRRDRETTL